LARKVRAALETFCWSLSLRYASSLGISLIILRSDARDSDDTGVAGVGIDSYCGDSTLSLALGIVSSAGGFGISARTLSRLNGNKPLPLHAQDKKVKYVAEHYYQFDGKSLGIANHLLNHTDLETKFAKHKPSIDYALNKAGTGYIFSETGGPLAIKEEKTTYFANTLWAVNFMLYSMSNGVQRVSLAQRPVAKRALWILLPGLSTPGLRVQAPFYAMLFIADFLGKEISGGRGAINVDLENPRLTAYAMYEGDKMARVTIVNLR
jgi:hypothetical protein